MPTESRSGVLDEPVTSHQSPITQSPITNPYGINVANLANRLLGLGLGKLRATLRPKQTKVWVQLFSVILAQFGVHSVPCDIDGTTIGFELESHTNHVI
jgi:hypothetical protein